MAFTHLHVRSQYSFYASSISIDDLIKKCIAFNMGSVAITDSGNIYNAYNFINKAKEHNIKPIVGCEIFIEPEDNQDNLSFLQRKSSHLVVLVKNQIGFKNLVKLLSISYLKQDTPRPTVSMEELSRYSEGLIALSSGLLGAISKEIISNQTEKADATAKTYLENFGNDNFYLELQNNGMAIQDKVNLELHKMGQRLSIPVVATNDCRYLSLDDHSQHDVLTCALTGDKLSNSNRFKLDTDQLYFKSSEKMVKLFSDYPETIVNTEVIASRCNLEMDDNLDFSLCETGLPDSRVQIERFTLKEALTSAGKMLAIPDAELLKILKGNPEDIHGLKSILQKTGDSINSDERDQFLKIASLLDGVPKKYSLKG